MTMVYSTPCPWFFSRSDSLVVVILESHAVTDDELEILAWILRMLSLLG